MNAADNVKRELILAAIEQFSEHGIEGVSLRTINRAAGAKNNSALHYHFGDKVGLIESIVIFIQDWFEQFRTESLIKLEASTFKPTANQILDVFISPYISLIQEESWGHNAVRFLSRMEMESNVAIHEILNRHGKKAIDRFRKLMTMALPELEQSTLDRRFNHCVANIIHGLAAHKALKNSYMGNVEVELEKLGELYIEYNAAGLSCVNG